MYTFFAYRCLDKEEECELVQRTLIMIKFALSIPRHMIDVR
jgi:hypothetical protein